MYDQLPQYLFPVTFNVLPGEIFQSVLDKLEDNQVELPFVVKPEKGCAGLLFRKIDTLDQLKEYHEKVNIEFIVQDLIRFPMEVSVFYYRMPANKSGTISGFLHKVPMFVMGDGCSTVLQLIQTNPKASQRLEELTKPHAANFDKVIPAGEKYQLSYAANHNRGAQFINLAHEIDGKLLGVFDELSFKVSGWFYGRYDIMCASVEDLKNDRNYEILEYNGCGAEPNHIYDSGYTLSEAYAEILKHWKAMYQISKYNNKHGSPYWKFRRGLNVMIESRRHFKDLRRLETELSF